MTQELIGKIKSVLGDLALEVSSPEDRRIVVKVDSGSVLDAAKKLREDVGFDMPISAGGTDYPKKKIIELFWIVWHSELNKVLILKCEVDRDAPEVQSLTEVWAGVQKFERETWELLGVYYRGHPRLKPLLLPEDWREGYPLRKDFDLKPYKPKWGDRE